MNDPLASRVVQARGDHDAAPLRIKRVEAIPVALPLTKPVVMAGERIEHAHNLLVASGYALISLLVGWMFFHRVRNDMPAYL